MLTSATVIGTVTVFPKDLPAIIVGTLLASATQNLMFHQDVFATAFVPLPGVGHEKAIQQR
ncbi:hypothetical protein [Xylella fastidiosa]|uniref:Uncharacterized protein n=1 Tax=Xylella fastidiosa subsp. multiplex TaxID=644357 RepID=A0A9Q4MGV2_XYLFS|nr:hypothetical protein [Xylella fastidiosa]ACA12311.1 conserved hypothetical protein [Xylella fastidiosa M12]MBE0269302.1 hypothetical protein [Xylella fastidiosa subsp. multiplex]MBE0275945.1 hypothetical protein [Xylella fastidiosa subsp. multiplex]MBE0278141.1 hypothetical protein [Xylella fastidiosa subsp. multiplex]MBE0282564.1 hypothetical protein [Xylella fastidiosa subsp. multiplex]